MSFLMVFGQPTITMRSRQLLMKSGMHRSCRWSVCTMAMWGLLGVGTIHAVFTRNFRNIFFLVFKKKFNGWRSTKNLRPKCHINLIIEASCWVGNFYKPKAIITHWCNKKTEYKLNFYGRHVEFFSVVRIDGFIRNLYLTLTNSEKYVRSSIKMVLLWILVRYNKPKPLFARDVRKRNSKMLFASLYTNVSFAYGSNQRNMYGIGKRIIWMSMRRGSERGEIWKDLQEPLK